MVGAVFKTVLPVDLVRFFDGTLAEQFATSNQISPLVWRIQSVRTNQKCIAVGDMLEKPLDEFIDGFIPRKDVKGAEVSLF